MSDGAIELKREGIKIAYRRFLSDSAAGFIVILLLLYVLPSPTKGQYERLFFNFLLFLISTPLGLAINALSYRVGETIVHYCEKRFVKRKIREESFLKDASQHEFLFHKCNNFFKLSEPKTDWIDVTRRILRILEIYYPDRYESHNHEIGAEVFFRNLAFIIFIIFCFGIWQCFANSPSASIFYRLGVLIFDFNTTYPAIRLTICASICAVINVAICRINWWITICTVIWLIIGAAIWLTTCPPIYPAIWLTIGLFIVLIGLFLWIASYLSYYYHLAMLCEAYNLCLEKPKSDSNTDQIIEYLIDISKKARRETESLTKIQLVPQKQEVV